MRPKSDIGQLLQRIVVNDDQEAFRQLVSHHQSPVRQFLRRLAGPDHGRADDLAQETFLKAYRYLHSYRGEGRFLSWLLKIAYQEFVKDLRRHKLDLASTPAELIPDQVRPHGTLESRMTVNQMLKDLGAEERAAVVLHYQEGLTHAEIADTMAIPLGTVKTHLRRGVAKLRGQHGAGAGGGSHDGP